MLSIGMNRDTVMCMMRTLKDFITTKREERGWNQTELAVHSGVPRTTLGTRQTGIMTTAGQFTPPFVLCVN